MGAQHTAAPHVEEEAARLKGLLISVRAQPEQLLAFEAKTEFSELFFLNEIDSNFANCLPPCGSCELCGNISYTEVDPRSSAR
jgi:hypothetical protein